jgi:DNA polymerase-3 subunit epsilon
LAQVYLELVGGRQARLQLAPGDARTLGIGFVRVARARPNPLPIRLMPEEREAHARFITGDVEGDVIWNWAA